MPEFYPDDVPVFEVPNGAKYEPPPPMPDAALVSMQEAVDWIEKARDGSIFLVEKQSHMRYRVKRYLRAA